MSVVSSQEENVNMAASTLERTQVFLCYSHDDIDLTDPKDTYGKELSQLLSIYRNQGLAEIWSDRQIAPGAEYLKKIDEAIARTKVALLLLSSAFLASDFIQQYELPRLLAAEAAGYLTIIPLLFRLCPYKKSGLAHFQSALPISKPLKSMKPAERDWAWIRIGEAIEQTMHVPAIGGLTANEHRNVLAMPSRFDISDDEQEIEQAAEAGDGAKQQDMQKQAGEDQRTEDDEVFAQAYREAVCGDPVLTSIQVLDMDHALKLDDIYVRVQIHRERRFRSQVEPAEQSVQDPLNILLMQQKILEERERAGMEPLQAVQKYPHCAVVGDPGAGKTTLLKYLALQCSKGRLSAIADCALFVSLHRFARRSGESRDLLTYVLEEWDQVYHLPVSRARNFLERKLRAGRMLVLLDALDETMIGEDVAAEQTYQTIHDAVSDLHRAYPQTPMVVTARKAAYHQYAPLVGFDLLEVVDFLPEQIEAFVKNWFQHDPDPERRSMAEGLLTRLSNNPRIAALAANPLLLGLIAFIYEEHNERLPNNRADLYKLCVETLLRKWDDKRKIRRTHPAIDTYEQERLLLGLAWHFHAQGLRYFSERELLEQIKEFTESMGRSTRGRYLQDILTEITGDNGLLREQAPGYYGFLHLTLQEYFAARHLASIHGLELLLEHLGHPWWEEVTLLYANLTGDASDLLARLPSPDGEAPEDIFSSKLLLAGRCLAAQVKITRARQLRAEIPRLLQEKLYSPFSLLQRQAAEVLAEIGRTYLEHEVNDWLFEVVANEQTDKRLRMIVLESIETTGGRQLQRRLLPLLWERNLDWGTREKIIDTLEQFRDRAIQQELKTKLIDDNLAIEARASVARLLCSTADSATLEWTLEVVESKENEILYGRILQKLVMTKRNDLPTAIPYILRLLQRFPPFRQAISNGIWILGQSKSQESMPILEHILFNNNIDQYFRRSALDALVQLNPQASKKILDQILDDPAQPELLRSEAVSWPIRRNQAEKFLRMLRSRETPLTVRLTIAQRLAHWCTQEVISVLWEIFQQQKAEEITQENVYFYLQPLILLLEQGERKAIQETIEILENVRHEIWQTFIDANGERHIHVSVPDGSYYTTFSGRIAKNCVDQADPLTLNAFCFNHQIHFLIRRDLIRQIAQIGKNTGVHIPAFFAELKDRTVDQEVRVALAEALGELATDEEAVRELLEVYEGEDDARVKDALYMALYKVARRANVTVVASGVGGSVLQVVRR